MKRAAAFIVGLALLLAAAPCVQGAAAAQPQAAYEGYIVKVSEQAPMALAAMDAASRPLGAGFYLVDEPEDAGAIADEQFIEYIEPNYVLEAFDVPDGYTPETWSLQAVNAEDAWAKGLYGDSVKVALIDSGLRTTHEDLRQEHILPVVNFTGDGMTVQDATGHGTVVGGVLAAQAGNAQSPGTPVVDGAAPDVTVLPLRVFSPVKTGTVAMAVDAINYAVSADCDVINMSFGIYYYSSALDEACSAAADAGLLLVAAAGNRGSTEYAYPAALDSVVSVAAVEQTADGICTRADFSQYNNQVFVTAPGADIASLSYTGDGAYVSGKEGTSFSAPLVTALAAFAKEQNRALTQDGFEKLLIATAQDLGPAGRDVQYGYGMVDFSAFADEITRDYEITFANAGEMEAMHYRLSLDEPLVLPTPQREAYLFSGWYGNEALTGDPVEAILPGSVGDITLYAAWEAEDAAEVSSVTVQGYEAVRAGDAFTVTLPKGSFVSAGDIEIRTLAAQTAVSVPAKDGDIWRFCVTSSSGNVTKPYTLSIVISDNSAPQPVSASVTGRAVPPSADGLQAAQAYTASVGAWFTDADGNALRYELTDAGDAAGTVSLSAAGTLTYTPAPEDAEKTLCLRLRAYDGMFYSGEVEVRVAVAARPVSQPVLNTSQLEYDLYAPSDTELGVTLYEAQITSVAFAAEGEAPEPLTAGEDYSVLSSSTGTYDALVLKSSFLAGKRIGRYVVEVSFSAGEARSATLTVKDSAPTYTVVFSAINGSTYARRENVRTGATVALPAQPTREGFSFDGWYTGKNGAGRAFTAQTPVTSDITVYAKWILEGGGGFGGGGGGGMMAAVYKITASAGEGGSVSPTSVEVEEGGRAAITVTPDAGFAISQILVDGAAVALPDGISASYAYTFEKVDASHTLEARFTALEEVIEPMPAGALFDDVAPEDWFYNAVGFVSGRSLFQGTGERMFSPDAAMTRAMLVTVLWRMEGEPAAQDAAGTFGDLTQDWYTPAVRWASSAGIVDGTGQVVTESGAYAAFSPDAEITREQLAAILYRYAAYKRFVCETGSLDAFSDAAQASAYAREPLAWAVGTGILEGRSDATLDPRGDASRCEVAAMLMRFMEAYGL